MDGGLTKVVRLHHAPRREVVLHRVELRPDRPNHVLEDLSSPPGLHTVPAEGGDQSVPDDEPGAPDTPGGSVADDEGDVPLATDGSVEDDGASDDDGSDHCIGNMDRNGESEEVSEEACTRWMP